VTSDQTFIIVGASLTGAKAAETLREEGFNGRILLLGAERERPYERPPLSKDYLRGAAGRERVYVHDPRFYDEQGIELRTGGQVESLDLASSEIILGGAERLRYDRLLLATGAEPRRPHVPGAELDGVYYLRTVEDSERLRERLVRGSKVVVVGAGWIGMEVAASARERGAEVSLIAPSAVPFERILGPEVGALYRDIHADHGVELLLGSGVDALHGRGSVCAVLTHDEQRVDCDFVVVGVGVEPRTQLADAAGIAVENGIAVDERLETSAPGVFAAGDVANTRHPFYGTRIRVERWANALNQGPAAGWSMLGAGA
jgi:3-phenylpropionate/trans-cinnamate dioxygenase ferredoxin reductase component